MQRKRIIDMISQQADEVRVPEVWGALMEPFINACHIPPHEASSRAYCEVEEVCTAWRYLSLKLDGTLRLASTSEAQEHNMEILLSEKRSASFRSSLESLLRPILIVGEAGAGKTTWLHHFFYQERIRERFYHYRFDGLISLDPFESLTHEEHLRRNISTGLFHAMKEASQRYDILTPLDDYHDELAFTATSKANRAGVLRESNRRFLSKGKVCWVIVDNLDQQPREFQECAIEYSKSLARDCFGVIVVTRPHTARERSLNDMFCVTVPAPSLHSLLQKRIRLAVEGYLHINPLVRLISEHKGGVRMTWSRDLTDATSLKEFYEDIVSHLCALDNLVTLLKSIHCHNLHEILRDMRELLLTGSFCKELRLKLEGEERDDRVFVTSYMTGRYFHHRQLPHSGERIVNLYDAPVSRNEDRFLLIRILQVTRKLATAGVVAYSELTETLRRFGYHGSAIAKCVRLMVRAQLLAEVRQMRDRAQYEPSTADLLTLTASGEYYLAHNAHNPRYVCAMSHVTHLRTPVVDEDSIVKESTVNDGFWNAALLAEDIRDALHEELQMVAKRDMKREFLSCIERSDGFFVPLVINCAERVSSLGRDGVIDNRVKVKWKNLLADARRVCEEKERWLTDGDLPA